MTFGELTKILLFEKNNYKAIYDGLHALHDFYASITGISAEQTTDGNIFLPVGKAISPGQAANCLLDLQRTVVFLRGIHKAIIKQQQELKGAPVHILYAGCGPYATLLTPLTTLFSPQQVRFHLIDVNPHSVDAVKQLYEKIQAMDYAEEIICADASSYTLAGPMHIVVCEAMQSALAREPQVAITLNLVPQLADNAIFIPERISVTAQLLNRDKEMEGYLAEGSTPERINLGEVYAIGRHQYQAPKPVDITIPSDITGYDELHLITEIDVFENEQLKVNNSGITLTSKVMEVREVQGKTIQFQYEINDKPGFRWTVKSNAAAMS